MASAISRKTPVLLDARSNARIAIAGVGSVLAHALVGALLTLPSGAGPGLDPDPLEFVPPESQEARIRPGIDRSRQITMNWLGFQDPTPHSAAPSEVDQAALSPLAAGVPDVQTPVEPTPAELAQTEPEPRLEVESEPIEPIEQASVETPSEPQAEQASTSATLPALALETESATRTARRLYEQFARAAAALREVAQTNPERPLAQADQPTTQPPTQPVSQPGETASAEPSPKQADASSREVLDYAPGRPPAAEGLDITTVNPRWTPATRLSRLPRNPIVDIRFRKDGTVAFADFVEGSGHIDVDGPLLAAVYAWTARGNALDALATDSPNETADITVRFLLVREPGTRTRARSGR